MENKKLENEREAETKEKTEVKKVETQVKKNVFLESIFKMDDDNNLFNKLLFGVSAVIFFTFISILMPIIEMLKDGYRNITDIDDLMRSGLLIVKIINSQKVFKYSIYLLIIILILIYLKNKSIDKMYKLKRINYIFAVILAILGIIELFNLGDAFKLVEMVMKKDTELNTDFSFLQYNVKMIAISIVGSFCFSFASMIANGIRSFKILGNQVSKIGTKYTCIFYIFLYSLIVKFLSLFLIREFYEYYKDNNTGFYFEILKFNFQFVILKFLMFGIMIFIYVDYENKKNIKQFFKQNIMILVGIFFFSINIFDMIPLVISLFLPELIAIIGIILNISSRNSIFRFVDDLFIKSIKMIKVLIVSFLLIFLTKAFILYNEIQFFIKTPFEKIRGFISLFNIDLPNLKLSIENELILKRLLLSNNLYEIITILFIISFVLLVIKLKREKRLHVFKDISKILMALLLILGVLDIAFLVYPQYITYRIIRLSIDILIAAISLGLTIIYYLELKNVKDSNQSDNEQNNRLNTVLIIVIAGIIILNVILWGYFFIKKDKIKKNQNINKVNERIVEGKNNNENAVNKENTQNINTQSNTDSGNYNVKAGYTYKKDNGRGSTFIKRSLGYERNLIGVDNQYQAYMDIKSEYCNAINEIEKVDKGIVPGTNKPFTQATYTEVDDAYREYLQQIAQIRQVVILAVANEDMENEAGCYYKGTHWNNANSQYRAKQFYNDEIDSYYNTYGN